MTMIEPIMTTERAVARTDAHAWEAGTLVWVTWPAESRWPAGPGIPLEWVPGRVLGLGREEKTRQVEVKVHGGLETVSRADVELLLRYVPEDRKAIVRRGQGLTPQTEVYQITYLHDGKDAGKSLARGDEIESWREDLRREGYVLDEG